MTKVKLSAAQRKLIERLKAGERITKFSAIGTVWRDKSGKAINYNTFYKLFRAGLVTYKSIEGWDYMTLREDNQTD